MHYLPDFLLKSIVFCLLINSVLLQSCTKAGYQPSLLPKTKSSSLSLSSAAGVAADNAGESFILGVSGHAISQSAYLNTPVKTQVALINDFHMSYYKVDISTNAAGKIYQENNFYELVNATNEGKIKILPLVYSTGLDYNLSTDTAFHRAYTLGIGFSKKYGQYFDYYEMGNELDWEVLIDRTKYGTNTEDYDLKKFAVLAAYFNGMNEGLKSGDPTCKTMVSANTNHTGFYKLLKQNRVNFDIIADHFYLDADYSIPWYNRVLDTDLQVFNYTKPVWITETNRWKGSYENAEEEQNTLVTAFIKNCKANPYIQAMFIYELLDEPGLPVFVNHEIFEQNFGLIKWQTPYTSFTYKNLASSLHNQ